jgi:hypothetical protein
MSYCLFHAAPCTSTPATQCNANPFTQCSTWASGALACKADCLPNYEGGYTATCSLGTWSYAGSCTRGEACGVSDTTISRMASRPALVAACSGRTDACWCSLVGLLIKRLRFVDTVATRLHGARGKGTPSPRRCRDDMLSLLLGSTTVSLEDSDRIQCATHSLRGVHSGVLT